MRRIFFPLVLFAAALSASAARAACPSPLGVATTAGVTTGFSVSPDAAGNCSSNITASGLSGGSATPLIACGLVATYNASNSGPTRIVIGVSGQKIRVCGYAFFVGATAATNVGLEYGTGTNCGTSTGTSTMPPSFPIPAGGAIVDHVPFWNGIATPSSNDLCLLTSAGNPVTAIVYYDQAT
jgi:hypothetical protein